MTRGGDLLERDHYPILVAELAFRGITAVYHPYDSRRSAEGFPDFTIAGVGRWILFAELKLTGKPLTAAQAGWLLALRGPWRACLAVDVAQLPALLVAVDNMKAGRLDDRGPTGFGTVMVLGDVRGLAPLAGAVSDGRGRPVDSPAGGPTPTQPPRRTLGTRRRRRGW